MLLLLPMLMSVIDFYSDTFSVVFATTDANFDAFAVTDTDTVAFTDVVTDIDANDDVFAVSSVNSFAFPDTFAVTDADFDISACTDAKDDGVAFTDDVYADTDADVCYWF
mgnify:FL=1